MVRDRLMASLIAAGRPVGLPELAAGEGAAADRQGRPSVAGAAPPGSRSRSSPADRATRREARAARRARLGRADDGLDRAGAADRRLAERRRGRIQALLIQSPSSPADQHILSRPPYFQAPMPRTASFSGGKTQRARPMERRSMISRMSSCTVTAFSSTVFPSPQPTPVPFDRTQTLLQGTISIVSPYATMKFPYITARARRLS